MHRKDVAEAIKRRAAQRAAAELRRRKVAVAVATSASGAIAMITMATLACWH